MIADEGAWSRAGMEEFADKAGRKCKLEEGIGGAFEIRTVAIPPGFFRARHVVGIDVLRLHHFEEAGFPMRASPATQSTATVGSFRNSEVADRVIDHYRSRAELPRDLLSTPFVRRPDARRESKMRVVRARNSLHGIADCLNRKDRSKGFFLEEAHRGIHLCHHRRLEEIRPEIRTRFSAAENLRASLGG